LIDKKSIFPLFLSEFIGTALLLTIGLSIVIFFWGKGSPITRLIPNQSLRRAVNGFLFGCTGCAITLSKVGKISGAHINPAVSIAFWIRGKMKTKALLGYIVSQMLGAVVGCLPLLLWGTQGGSIDYGNTVPAYGLGAAFIGEMITTAALIIIIFVFVGSKNLRHYTPYTMPFLYSVMVCIEAPFSGCSTNPARSFGPAVISNVYTAYWLYWLAPVAGVIIVTGFFRVFRLYEYYRIEAARVSYHNSPTHESIRTTDKVLKG
jgi:aquaporin Z